MNETERIRKLRYIKNWN